MALLAFETSCDETSVAVIDRGVVLASEVASQIRLHSEYGGVVPELAAREHLRNLAPVAARALQTAGVTPEGITAVAATRGPGLPSALMAGLKAAQAVAFVLRRPFFAMHHHEAHLYSPWIQGEPGRADFDNFQPNVSLIASGGHTLLVFVSSDHSYQVLGATLDDAAGECFDKTGKLMGLPYPAGPVIERLARGGNPATYDFPRPKMTDADDDFSFSGLKTSVRYFLRDHPGLLEEAQSLADFCASVQSAIIDVLAEKTIRAARRLRVSCVTISGGVACNAALRETLERRCARHRLSLRAASRGLCTDNAAMIGILAERRIARGCAPTDLDADILPGWELGQLPPPSPQTT